MRDRESEHVSAIGMVPGRKPGRRFEIDPSGRLSDPLYLFSYHALCTTAGSIIDLAGRVNLTRNGSVAVVLSGGPEAEDFIVLDFPGVSSAYLSNASTADWWSGSTPFSGSCWFRLDALPPPDDGPALVSRVKASDGGGFTLLCYNAGGAGTRVLLYTDPGADAGSSLTHGTNLSATTWYHAAWAWDGTKRYLWLDGGSEASDTPGFTPAVSASDTEFRIGGQNSGGFPRPLDGRICHVAQWRGLALTPSDVQLLYNGGKPNRLRTAA